MPQGYTVVSGTASITQTGNQLKVVQTTPKVAINWQSYGIAANEIVTYYQPSARAIALNRVLGGGISNIYLITYNPQPASAVGTALAVCAS